MKIGLLTYHNHFNYGASLQAYALAKTISSLGHDCRIVDYATQGGRVRGFSRSRHPYVILKNIYLAWHWRAARRFRNRFEQFTQECMPLTSRRYESFDELAAMDEEFDALVTGSDQIFHPLLLDREIGRVFHLEFASPERYRLIAYAPSFGVSEVPETYVARIRDNLARYHALSVREQHGQEIIKKVSGRVAQVTLDPTLLLNADDYEQILMPPVIQGDYLLVYPMETGVDHGFYHTVRTVKKQLMMPVAIILPRNFNHRWLLLADRIILDAGPKQYLGLIKNAAFFCTNSFHGTVFSILFNKQFLGFRHSKTNSRIDNLLQKTDLRDRQLVHWDERAIRDRLVTTIDYDPVQPRLRREIDKSIDYLVTALR